MKLYVKCSPMKTKKYSFHHIVFFSETFANNVYLILLRHSLFHIWNRSVVRGFWIFLASKKYQNGKCFRLNMHNQIVSANLQGSVAHVGNFYSLQKWKLTKWQPSKSQNSLGQGLINYSKGGFVKNIRKLFDTEKLI